MRDAAENELLSAYLDGELTAAEQAEVEQLLLESAEARQVLDEMRALSATLQGLPQRRVGEDLSERVLRVAERRMVSEPAPIEAIGPALNERPARSGWAAVMSRVLRPRNFVWSAAVVLVALGLMLFERAPKQPPQEQVAQHSADTRSTPVLEAVETPTDEVDPQHGPADAASVAAAETAEQGAPKRDPSTASSGSEATPATLVCTVGDQEAAAVALRAILAERKLEAWEEADTGEPTGAIALEIEATPEELTRLVAALKARDDAFLAVAETGAARVAQGPGAVGTATGPMGDAGTVNARKSSGFGSASGGIGMRVRAGSTSLGGASAEKTRVRILLQDAKRAEPPAAPAAIESAR